MRATRRDFLRKADLAGSLVTIPAVAGTFATDRAEAGVCSVTNDDAELLQLGAELDRLYVVWAPLAIKERELAQKTHDGMKAAYIPFNPENLKACYAATGLDRVCDACEALLDRMDPIAERMFALPVHTIAGLAALARALRFVMIFPAELSGPEDDLNYNVQCFVKFQRALGHLEGTL